MKSNIIELRKEAIPNLLSLLGKAMGSQEDIIVLKEVVFSGGLKHLYLGEETVDSWGDNSGLPGNIGGFSEDEIDEMEETLECKETGSEVDKYYCKHICGYRHECN